MSLVIWQAKTGGSYSDMLPPTTYDIEYEDLDYNTYRSKATGNLIDTVISKKWSKLMFKYVNLTASQVDAMFDILDQNPIFIKAKNPRYGTEIEMQMRCSRVKVSMIENNNYNLDFNLVQKTKVVGQ